MTFDDFIRQCAEDCVNGGSEGATQAGTPPEVPALRERLATVVHEASYHTCELGMDKVPLPWRVSQRIANAIADELAREGLRWTDKDVANA